ncbi:hypothetical protein [Brevibacillus sp. NRS-1366]|uniref:hypothetical protein n=1 Tax=Brevibacillus sp. NRS-1366 TaxID=3233899 RepID=UPI003D2372A0
MEKYLDSMRRTIELSDTGIEALEHIQLQLNEGYLEQALELFGDVVDAFLQMEQSLALFLPFLPSNQLEEISKQVKNGLEMVAATYEMSGNRKEILNFLDQNVLPDYRLWQGELQRSLQPIIFS